MSEVILHGHQNAKERVMSDDPKTQRLEWGFRLLIMAFVALWVIYPPHRAAPTATASIAARIAP